MSVRSLSVSRLFCIVLTILVTACVSPTPYEPATMTGDAEGYVAYPLEEKRYRVMFSGNAVTPRDTVENYLLYRAAEVTVETGHDYFRVVDESIDASTTYRTSLNGLSTFRPYSRRDRYIGAAPGFATARSRPITSYEAEMEIVVATGQKPADDLHAYDARSVIASLEPAIVRPHDLRAGSE